MYKQRAWTGNTSSSVLSYDLGRLTSSQLAGWIPASGFLRVPACEEESQPEKMSSNKGERTCGAGNQRRPSGRTGCVQSRVGQARTSQAPDAPDPGPIIQRRRHRSRHFLRTPLSNPSRLSSNPDKKRLATLKWHRLCLGMCAAVWRLEFLAIWEQGNETAGPQAEKRL